jgi:hypothetical protein
MGFLSSKHCGPKQEFDIAAQMIDARGGDLRAAFGFGQYECALQHRLGVQREASCGAIGSNAVTFHGFGNTRLDRGRDVIGVEMRIDNIEF